MVPQELIQAQMPTMHLNFSNGRSFDVVVRRDENFVSDVERLFRRLLLLRSLNSVPDLTTMVLKNSIVSRKWDDFKALDEASKLRFATSIVAMEEEAVRILV